MKKVFFTIALTCATLITSAQFTIVSQVQSPNDGDSWEKLCSFLDIPIPNEDFPHEQ